MTETGKKMQRNISIILIGAIISMALSAMYISGSTSFDAFYDVEVFEVGGFSFYNGVGVAFNYDSGKQEIREELAYQELNFSNGLGKCNYFVLKLSDLSKDSLPVSILFYKNGERVQTVITNLKNGENVVEILRKDADKIQILMKSQQGTSYDIESVQCREKLQVWNSYKFFGALVLVFFVYLIIVYFVRKVLRKRNICVFQYKILEKLQKIYGKVEEKIADTWKFPKQEKASVLRKILFFLLVFIINYEFKTGMSMKTEGIWSRNVWIYCIILIAIAVLSIEKKHRILNWKNPLVYSWFLLAVCMIISNFIVEKFFKNVGIILLLVFGFLFYVWGNMSDRRKLLQEFCTAIKWEFWIEVGYCFLFCPEVPGIRYVGSFSNSNAYATYVIIPWVVFFSDLVEKKREENLYHRILSALGCGISFCFIWKTQCRTILLGVILVLFAGLFILRREWRMKKKQERKSMLCLLLVVVLGSYMGQIGITILPKFQEEESITEQGAESLQESRNSGLVMQVEAAENQVNRIKATFTYSRTLDEFSSGRTALWKAYLRQMNLWGHKNRALVNGHGELSHNAFLSIAFEYGVFSVIPYLYWIVYYLWYAFGYLRQGMKRRDYAVFPLFLIISIIPILLLENAEQPFRQEIWVAMYLTAGILFEKDTEAEQVN